jgi:hypothetical protein
MIINFLGFSISLLWAMFVLFFWVIIALWPAFVAKGKGHSFFGWFLLSLFFWWITLFVVYFVLKDKTV